MITERDIKQGSPEWNAARVGNLGATSVERLVTSTGKKVAPATRKKFLYEFAAEVIQGSKKEFRATPAMDRGTELEPKARASFQFETGLKVEEVGLIYPDEMKLWHISPDGLIIGQKKGLEIKAPMLSTHLEYLEENKLPTAYKIQVQASLACTDYDSWYFMSFNPDVRPLILEIGRDEVLIDTIKTEIMEFLFDLKIMVDRYRN